MRKGVYRRALKTKHRSNGAAKQSISRKVRTHAMRFWKQSAESILWRVHHGGCAKGTCVRERFRVCAQSRVLEGGI